VIIKDVGPLRGRDSECAELGQLVGAAAGGAGGVTVVNGAAGIGKSRLLAEAAQIAAAQGVQVAAGAADELDQVTPSAPLLRALFSTSPMLLSEADLAPLRVLADQRLAVIECIRAALEQASRRRPLLITLDDLQWADPATLLALGSLPGQLFSYPIAWILARRPVPSSPQLQGLIARLTEAGAGRLHLLPLDATAARALAADMLGGPPDSTVAELIDRAEGNPFYIAELLRGAGGAAPPPAATDPARSPSATVPVSLRSAVAAHLRSLPDEAKDLLKVASVLGREFTVSELAAMTSQSAGQLMPALEEVLSAEVFAEQGARLAFRHDLLRQAVYADIPASLRQALHCDAATALRRAGAPLVRVASQYAVGAQPADEEAIEVLVAAAGQLSGTAPAAAADLAVRALDLLGDGDQRRAAMTAAAVGLLGWAGRPDEARAVGEGYLADRRPPPEPEAEAGILLGMRRAWAMRSWRPYPSPLAARVLEDPAVPAGIRASLLAYEQAGPMLAGHFADADRAFASAMRLAAESGDAREAGTVLGWWVVSAVMRGDLSAALDRARAGLDTARQDESKVAAAVIQDQVARCLGGLGRTREALAAVEPALREAEASGFTPYIVHAQYCRALLLSDQGRLDDARTEARAAAAFAETVNSADLFAWSLALLVETSIRQGDLAEAKAATARLPADPGGGSLYPERHWAHALCLEAQGRPGAALEALEPVFAQLRRGCLTFAARQAGRLPKVAGLALRTGNRQRTAEAAAAAAELARRNPGVDLLAGIAAHARGLLGRDQDGLQQAADLLAGSEWPLAAAAAREDLGCLLAEHGACEEAAVELEAAYQAYLDARAHHDNARVRGTLRQLGIRKRRPAIAGPDHGWASLTAAELAVAQIVAEGRTNRETAAQLYLSPDTINTHLRHAFTKLGIRSRVELARLAAGRERTPDSA
jgi:DNA-binding CsgD family transcriptional regulator